MKNRSLVVGIIVVSILVPLLVAILFSGSLNLGLKGQWVGRLPAFHALINSTTTVLLVAALIAIKKKKVTLHHRLMITCFFLGLIFLISYITYHGSADSTIFGDVNHDGAIDVSERAMVGNMRGIYIFTLLTHIGFSIGVVPLVLMAFYFALSGKFERHKKIVKYAYPIWLYVSITGVLVYLMIRPYYLC